MVLLELLLEFENYADSLFSNTLMKNLEIILYPTAFPFLLIDLNEVKAVHGLLPHAELSQP